MKAIGIDIGTTTICAVVIDADTGNLLTSKTLPNTSAISSSHSYEKLQDTEKIFLSARHYLTLF